MRLSSIYPRIPSLVFVLFAGTTPALTGCAQYGKSGASLTIPAGHDMFVTRPDGRTYFYLGGSGSETIPQGFFGCTPRGDACLPSDPVDRPVKVVFEGVAVDIQALEPSALDNSPCKWVSDDDKFGTHCADGVGHFSSTTPEFPSEPEDSDTIVLRTADLSFDAIGDVRSIPIELVALSLRSVKPIEIGYGAGQITQRFHLRVTAPHGDARTGTMVVSRTAESAGTYFSRLPVAMAIEFLNAAPDGPAAVGSVALDLDFVGAEVPWEYVPEPPAQRY